MHISSIITLCFSLCAFTNAYSCASWVIPADCLKQAAAFSLRMKTATFSMPKPEATGLPDGDAPAAAVTPAPPASPPNHRNCGTLGIMDANDAPCDKMYKPKAAQPSPVTPPVPEVEAEKEQISPVARRLAIPLQV